MASLEVSLKDIPFEGLDYVSEVTHADLDLGEGDPKFKGSGQITARIQATENEAWVDGEFLGILVQDCVRCLNTFERNFNIPVTAYYRGQSVIAAKEKSKSQKEEDIDSEETDSYPILNDSLNLADMLREQLILSLPIRPLCKEHCLGLCPVCGQNLNQQQCGCEIQAELSPFAILKDKLKPSKKSEG